MVLQLNDQRFTLHIGPGRFDLLETEPADPAAVVTVSLRTMATLADGGTTIAEAERTGHLTITGTRAAGLRLLRYLSITAVRRRLFPLADAVAAHCGGDVVGAVRW